MDLSTYEQLSGVTCNSRNKTLIAAKLRRCQSMLETMLGFPLSPDLVTKNLYNELGKSQREFFCPHEDTEDLLSPDEVIGSYRLFDWGKQDDFIAIDPYKRVHKVKLVHVRSGLDGASGITLRTFTSQQMNEYPGIDGVGKYLQRCRSCLDWRFGCGCTDNCVQLAVDADWLWGADDSIPDDLAYVLIDMVQYYSDAKRHLQLESITTHTYRKFNVPAPELEPNNAATIKKYAGVRGSVNPMPTQTANGNDQFPFYGGRSW